MCAITGLIELTNSTRSVSPEIVKRMANAQIHRGPDEAGHFCDPGIALGHRRLSLVGLENGRQSIQNEDGSIVVVANGEFFDHVEKRASLESKGHQFSTRSDCEILVHLWEEYGINMLRHLRGQFAFALWYRKKRSLILARDRFGIVPLHWTKAGDRLLFSSEIKGLLASGLVPAESDHRGLDHIFSFFAIPSRRTCFKGIPSILPGHFLKIDGDTGSIDEHQYWDFDFPDQGDEYNPGIKKAAAEFGEHLTEATRLRLRADVPLGCYLSGGVDSTTLLQLAAKTRADQKSVPAFTIEIPCPKLNELSPAKHAAEQVGAKQHVITCDANTIGNAFPQLVEACEAPVMDTSSAALLCLSGLVREQGFKTVLSGEGADEGLAGYPWFKTNHIMSLPDHGEFRPSNIIRRMVGKVTGRDESWAEASRHQSLIGGAPAMSDFYGLLKKGRRIFYSHTMWDEIDGHLPYEDLKLDLDKMKRWDPLNQSLYFGYKTILPGLLMNQ